MFRCPNCRNEVYEYDTWCDVCGQSLETFVGIYRKAQYGDTDAQMLLGGLYRQGVYVDFNPQKGFHWTKKAADSGNAHAKLGVACCYLDGVGVEQNPIRAIYWLLEARNAGDTDAANKLRQLGIADGHYLNEDTPLSIRKL